jgi:flavin reductase (DIM6/NTAB) family NADH-FMN oxidoreductase RutF
MKTNEKLKSDFKPGTMVYPLPAVLVSCGSTPEEYNLITIAWTGTICSDPPMCYISVRPGRYSYDIIKRNMEFVINLTTEKMAKATDWCGCRSGSKFNKWKETGLTPGPSLKVKAPIVMEAPVSIECKVTQIIDLGVHHMFMAEVVNIRVDNEYMHNESGKFDLAASDPLVYLHGAYYKLGKKIGKFGWAVEKKPAQRKVKKSK